jgi:hypothetical protein
MTSTLTITEEDRRAVLASLGAPADPELTREEQTGLERLTTSGGLERETALEMILRVRPGGPAGIP